MCECSSASEEAFLVCIQNRHKRNRRNVKPFTQQVYTHKNVEKSVLEVLDDFHPLHGIHIGMDVAATNAHFCEIFLQLLGHPFGKSGNKHPFVHFGPFADFLKQVIHLIFHRTNLNRRVKQSGRPYNLLNHKAFRLLKLVVCRSCAHKYLLSCNLLEFIEFQRPVVRCSRESEPIVNQYALPRMVTTVHGTNLRQGNMALVDECNEILGEIVNQAERPHPFLPSVEISGIILDSGAITHFLDELEIIFHPLLQPLGFQCFTY